jgi:TonB-dependent SusC/RagA subfamily outer membrane receptor
MNTTIMMAVVHQIIYPKFVMTNDHIEKEVNKPSGKPGKMKNGIILLIVFILIIPSSIKGQNNNIKKDIISGYVTDVNNQPVADALILTDRQQTDVVTNRKGFFKVRITPETRMIGAYSTVHGSAEAPLDGEPEIKIILYGTFAITGFMPKSLEGEEMVNIGYGKARKKDLATSPGYIDGSGTRYNSYISIYDMIRGEVPGVQVTGDKILIRGASSINLSNDPLFIVDGMAVSSINHIMPREVKSISILKGSDAAIYGTRAAGGVILIDLKGATDR